MFEDIRQIRKFRRKYQLHMVRSGLNTFREMGQLHKNTFQDGALARKQKELIALAIGISHSCYG